MRRLRRAAVFLTALVVVSIPGIAYSAGKITGTVTRLSNGSPIKGAVVTLAAPDQRPLVATTAANGKFSIDAGGSGPYSVSVQASGYAGQSIAAVQPGTPLPVALDSATYTPLPVYAGSTMTTAADATSGVFYAVMNQAPEVYRTLDHGGTWQPVPMRYEDPDTGLNRGPGALDVMAASAVSGEIAVTSGGRVHFSTDYGLTWRMVSGELPGSQATKFRFLFWGHASATAPNVLVVAQSEADGTWSTWRADMSAAEPALAKEAADPFGAGSVIAGAHSADGSFLGRVTAAGELSFARLASGQIAFGPTEAASLPTPPQVLRLGGVKEGSAPPDGALVVGGSGPPFSAQLLTKSAGSTSFAGGSFSAPTPVPTACRFREGLFDASTGSVAPATTGDAGLGSVGQCWVKKSGVGALTVHETCCEARDISYDANWGASNHALLRAGSSGPVKAARLDGNGVPDFTPGTASAGTDPASGGLSVQGIVSPVVDDTGYGPAGAQQLGIAINGGQLTIASRDGGQSFTPIVNRGWGATAVQWWQGASGPWLVFGNGQGAFGGNLLSAVLNWDGVSSLGMPNVQGSRQQDLGGTPSTGYGIQSLQAIPGTDTILIGLGMGFDPVVDSGNHLYRARIVPGSPPSLADVVSLDPAPGGTTLYLPKALAYCPSSSGDTRMQDVLFVATGDSGGLVAQADTKGSLLRITSVTGASPAVSEIASIPHGTQQTQLTDVRADCAQGVVYTGGQTNGSALYKSTDAGLTFAPITLTGPGGTNLAAVGPITAIGLNPGDPNDVKVAAGLGGMITHSTDGGATWTILNDPAVHRPAPVNDIEFAPGGGGLAATSSGLALLGTGAGAFRANLSGTSGVIGVTPSARGTGQARQQITLLASDSHPAAVVAPSGVSTAVFRRSNGLYHASTSPRAGWSLPMLIPKTAGGAFPAAALDSAGGLHVAYAQRQAAPGIYVVSTSGKGIWSAPRRISKSARDTLPAIAVAGRSSVHVVFLRARGSMGVYHVSNTGGRWRAARKLRGTGVADAKSALGGPSLTARSGQLHLAFARAGRAPGIVYMRARGSRWSAPMRLTKARDSQPSIAISTLGARHIVFRRRGLFALRGTMRWSLARIPGTVRADTEPSLSASGAGFTLGFARPRGGAPGIYIGRTAAIGGGWPARPRRSSSSPKDRNPSLRGDRFGRETVVFERG